MYHIRNSFKSGDQTNAQSMNQSKHTSTGKKKNAQSLLFFKYFAPFLLVAGVVLLILVLAYNNVIRSVRKNVNDTVQKSIATNITSLNGTLSDLEVQAHIIGDDYRIAAVSKADAQMDKEPAEQYTLLQCKNRLLEFQFSAPVDNCYMISSKNKVFLSSSLVSTDRTQVYDTFYKVGTNSSDVWFGRILHVNGTTPVLLPEAPANTAFAPNSVSDRSNIIHYVVPLSSSAAGGSANRYFVYMLGSERLRESIGIKIPHSYVTLRQKDNILTSTVPSSIDLKKYTLVTSTHTASGIYAEYVIPNAYFKNMLLPARRTFLFFGVLCTLAAVTISFFLAFIQTKKMNRAYRAVKAVNPALSKVSMLDDIVITVDNLHEQCTTYKNKVVLLKSSLKTAGLEKLLGGSMTPADEPYIREILDIDEDIFFCSALRLNPGGEVSPALSKLELDETKIRKLIGMHTDTRYLLWRKDSRTMVLIFAFHQKYTDPSDIRSLQDALMDIGTPKVHPAETAVYFKHGPIVTDMTDIYDSALAALTLVDHQLKEHHSILLDVNEELVKLGSFILSGASDNIQASFLRIQEVLLGRSSEPEECQLIFFHIRAILEYVKESRSSDILLPSFSRKKPMNVMLSELRTLSLLLSHEVNLAKASEAMQKEHRILTYIEQTACDPELCAASIADHFHLSEKYIFSVVKTLSGRTLGDYIKQLRFEKVEALLRAGEDIKHIPQKAGFHSLNTFYKTFKQHYKVSPGEWRTQHKGGNI